MQGHNALQSTGQALKPSQDQTKKWIEELANRDRKPFDEPYLLKPPRQVDRASLAVVKSAYDNLAANVEIALPELIRSLDDRRYSYYQETSSGAFVCHSVSDACYAIIIGNVEIYREYTTVLDATERPRTVHFIEAMGGPKHWLAHRKDRSLYDMQLESVEWALKQSKPNPQELVSDADWKECIERLRDFYARFKANGKPVLQKNELWFEGK